MKCFLQLDVDELKRHVARVDDRAVCVPDSRQHLLAREFFLLFNIVFDAYVYARFRPNRLRQRECLRESGALR